MGLCLVLRLRRFVHSKVDEELLRISFGEPCGHGSKDINSLIHCNCCALSFTIILHVGMDQNCIKFVDRTYTSYGFCDSLGYTIW